MWFKSLMSRVPYRGNLVRAKYLVVSKIGEYLNKEMDCWSARIDPENMLEGLILSNSDLSEAHFRYIKYFDLISDNDKKQPIGIVCQRSFITKRPGAKQVDLLLTHFQQEGGERTGYLFAVNDMVRIVERSKKLEQTIKYPTRFQDVLIWINTLLGNLQKE